jgi:hypothetical protein
MDSGRMVMDSNALEKSEEEAVSAVAKLGSVVAGDDSQMAGSGTARFCGGRG